MQLGSCAVIGWTADFFRLALGLFYWNARKSWFRFRCGHSRNPCQSPSDSGRAFETSCEACIDWDRPARFRRVCPLLIETPQGLRCSAHAENVRPFWRRALGYYGVSLASIYLAGALGLFGLLRVIGYPVNVFQIIWPPAWHHLSEVRSGFFINKANRAFAAGHTSEGLLFLNNAYEFDPDSYTTGLLLAKTIQLGQPLHSDSIYAQLMRQHPEQRSATAQEWFRALLARGDCRLIEVLAREQICEDVAHSSVWVRALLFATQQTNSDVPLRQLLESKNDVAKYWKPLLEVELMLRSGHGDEARAALTQPWVGMPAYGLYYQIATLIRMNEAFKALDLLAQYEGRLDDEAKVTLRLDAYAQANSTRLTRQLADALLSSPPNLPTVKIIVAHLIRHPDPVILDQVYSYFTRAQLPVSSENVGIYLSLFCAAGVAQDWSKVHSIARTLKQSTGGNFVTLSLLESFFRGTATQTRISSFLPTVPLPLEVTYALYERYPIRMRSVSAKISP